MATETEGSRSIIGTGTSLRLCGVPTPRLYQHFAQTNLAYFLERMDAEIEENEKTLLDNTTVLIGTEYGKNHSSDGVFHAICGGGGRFHAGFFDQRVNAIDVYNAVLAGHGLPESIGDATGVESEGDASSVVAG